MDMSSLNEQLVSAEGAGQSSGVFYHRPEQRLIEALDQLFAGTAVDLTVQQEALSWRTTH